MELAKDFSPEAEEGLIGLALNGDHAAIDYLTSLDPDAFYVTMNQYVCAAIQKVSAVDRSMVSIDTVSEQLLVTEPAELDAGFSSMYEELGGREPLEDMASSMPALRGNTDQLYDTVNGYYVKRKMHLSLVQAMRDLARAELWNVNATGMAAAHSLNNIMAGSGKKIAVDLYEGSVELTDYWMDVVKNGSEKYALPELIEEINDRTGGRLRGKTSVVAARSEMGKTSYVIQDAFELALKGFDVVFVSIEMAMLDLIVRIATLYGVISALKINSGDFTEDDVKRVKKWFEEKTKGISFKIISNKSDCDDILAELSSLNRDHNVDFVAYDFVQAVKCNRKGKFFRTDSDEIAFAYQELVNAAKRPENYWHNCFIAQLNREIEGRFSKRPKKGDIGKTDQIVQWADNLMFLHREGYYSDTDEEGDVVDDTEGTAYFGKSRGSRKIPDTKLYYNTDYGRWESLAVRAKDNANEKFNSAPAQPQNKPYGSEPIAIKMNDDEDIPF